MGGLPRGFDPAGVIPGGLMSSLGVAHERALTGI